MSEKSDLVKPAEPTEPTEPAKQTEQAEPTEPTEPAKQTEPAYLAEQAEPAEPTEPAQPSTKKHKTDFVDVIRWAVLYICILGFLVSGYFVMHKLLSYYENAELNDELYKIVSHADPFIEDRLSKSPVLKTNIAISDMISGNFTEEKVITSTLTSEQKSIVANISRLKTINGDTAAWIRVIGLPINYPVMYNPYIKDFYLHRNFYTQYQECGTIFIDERNNKDISQNRNTVFYGHNMNDGSMFASLYDFRNATIFYSSRIEVATEEGIYVYTPFSVHAVKAYTDYFNTDFNSDEQFISYCNNMTSLSKFKTGYVFSKDDKVITLSTCAIGGADDDRFAVHAVLTEILT